MKLYRIIAVFLSVAFLLGCAGSSKKMNLLALGMTKKEVIQAIGEPTSTSAKRNTEYLNYRLTTGGFYSDTYYVRLLDGKVDAFGKAGDFNLGY
ncbi:MAG: hypothetical protein JRE65_18025 [Deltaproteobacteria bacterium]|jgi:hypothetical protein|nr:hypothetical protein [Deltaproteobacteria bacterium]